MAKPNKQIEARIRKLCDKFYEELQAIFDSDEMNDETYDGDVCQAAVNAQGYADEARHAD